MRERSNELGLTVWSVFLSLIAIAALVFGFMWINSYALPWQASIQRDTAENSKSFTDATNMNLANMKTEYVGLSAKIAEVKGDADTVTAYKAQQQAVLEQMCSVTATMRPNTIQSTIVQFINEHGGC